MNWIYQEMTAMNMQDELKKLLETLVPHNTVHITMDIVFMGISAADIAKTFDWNCVILNIEKEIMCHGSHTRI